MADVVRLLETMHAMREPSAPEPVTPILIALVIGCGVAAGLLVLVWQMRQRRAALRASAEAALAASRGLAPDERLSAQALLLRRLVRSLAGDAAARMRGPAWLAQLDEVFATRFFSEGDGATFGEDLYRRPRAIDVDGLDLALAALIAKVRLRKAPA